MSIITEVNHYESITYPLSFIEHSQRIDLDGWAHLIALGNHKRGCGFLDTQVHQVQLAPT
jgi:hypothetical protein